ncbi:MAG: TetR family transcriptional regulator [Cyanobacteria bacterium P01_F01_bin.42]
MPSSVQKPRQKLIKAALELFISQGITNTATRQIANLAEVNEATLFRNFGNKYGLLQAVVQEAEVFEALEQQIKSRLQNGDDESFTLKQYSLAFLEAIASHQALLCSLIGEAENYTPEFKKTLACSLLESNRRLDQLLQDAGTQLPPDEEALTGLLHGLLISYAVFRRTSQVPEPWSSPSNAVDAVLRWLLTSTAQVSSAENPVQDLPRAVVQALLQQAKKQSPRDFALLYLLFGAGLTPAEISRLRQSDRLVDGQQHVLTVHSDGQTRQVSLNQWILGRRYGSPASNPLTRWLKGRKDSSEFLLVTDAGLGMTVANIEEAWKQVCESLAYNYQLWQCQQTWQVEMMMRGVSVENLSILSGVSVDLLQPLAQRAREKAALEQAVALDKKAP